MAKKKEELSIRSDAAEYLTYVASIDEREGSSQVTRNTKHYNIQMIIAVGFKVDSDRAVHGHTAVV